MKKIFLFLGVCLVNTAVLSNAIKEAVKKQCDVNVAEYMPLLKQQREIIAKLGYTLGEQLTWADKKREAQRAEIGQSQEARKLFQDFNILNAQAIGMMFCEECLEKIPNPNIEDLDLCRIEWLDSSWRAQSLDIAEKSEELLKISDHALTKAFHEGNRQFEKQIRSIMKENSE